MSDAKTLLRLASRQVLDKVDVESVYGELVRVIGGTRFSTGTPIGPSNGLLDFRNFSQSAGILNTNKSEPYATGSIENYIRSSNSTAQRESRIAFTATNLGITPSFDAVATGWTLTVGSVTSTTNSATASIFRVRGGVNTQIGTDAVLTNYNQRTNLKNESGLLVDLRDGDWISFKFTQSGVAIGVNNVVAILYYKMLHTR